MVDRCKSTTFVRLSYYGRAVKKVSICNGAALFLHLQDKCVTMKRIILAAACLPFVVMGCKQKATEYTRVLPIEGAYNVRDLGGYEAADGKTVKWRTVLRSGDLNHLTDADLEYFASIPLVSYIDFRDSTEIANAPDRRPATLKNDFQLSIAAGSVVEMKDIREGNTDNLLTMGNEMFVRDFQSQFREFFHILQDPANTPLLFHCSAGKDRTGFAAAMFLSALGVDRETIIEDYLMSAELVREKYAEDVAKYPTLGPLLTVHRRYIEGAFYVIDTEYGGVENYLTNQLGVDIGLVRRLYTE